MSTSELVNRLRATAQQLQNNARALRFGGDECHVRVKSPDLLLADLNDAVSLLEHLEAERQNQAKALSEANELANRSTRRLAELAEPGIIGVFGSRDHWQSRALAAEARLAEASDKAWAEGAKTAMSMLDPLVHTLHWPAAQANRYMSALANIEQMISARQSEIRESRAARTLNAQEKA